MLLIEILGLFDLLRCEEMTEHLLCVPRSRLRKSLLAPLDSVTPSDVLNLFASCVQTDAV